MKIPLGLRIRMKLTAFNHHSHITENGRRLISYILQHPQMSYVDLEAINSGKDSIAFARYPSFKICDYWLCISQYAESFAVYVIPNDAVNPESMTFPEELTDVNSQSATALNVAEQSIVHWLLQKQVVLQRKARKFKKVQENDILRNMVRNIDIHKHPDY